MFRVALFVYTWIVDYTIWWKFKLKLLLIATCLIGSCCSSNVLSRVKYIELCFRIDLFSWHTYVHKVHNSPFRHFTHDHYFHWTFSSTVKSSIDLYVDDKYQYLCTKLVKQDWISLFHYFDFLKWRYFLF